MLVKNAEENNLSVIDSINKEIIKAPTSTTSIEQPRNTTKHNTYSNANK